LTYVDSNGAGQRYETHAVGGARKLNSFGGEK
jgi:hypothetical protein